MKTNKTLLLKDIVGILPEYGMIAFNIDCQINYVLTTKIKELIFEEYKNYQVECVRPPMDDEYVDIGGKHKPVLVVDLLDEEEAENAESNDIEPSDEMIMQECF